MIKIQNMQKYLKYSLEYIVDDFSSDWPLDLWIWPFRPGKVDSLFPINHFLDFDASRWSLFIVDYVELIQPGAIHACFLPKSYNHRRNLFAKESCANKRSWHIVSAIMKVEVVGFCYMCCLAFYILLIFICIKESLPVCLSLCPSCW